MSEPLVSTEVCAAFPIAICIAFAGFCALYFGWRMIADALSFRRFCAACGGRKSAFVVIEAAEATADAAADVMLESGLRDIDRDYELTSEYRVRRARYNDRDCE